MSRSDRNSGLAALATVFSTEHGRLCPDCAQPQTACRCRELQASVLVNPPGTPVRVLRDSKGRAGKGVTVVHGLSLRPAELAELAKALKQRCGSGGTVNGITIEIQGEHRDTVVAELAKRGIQAKRGGG